MALTMFRAVEVTGPNTIKVGESYPPYKPVYLPYVPQLGKEAECEEALREILAGENSVSVLVITHFTTNPVTYDVRSKSANKPISDMLVERGLAIKWNWPGNGGR